MPRGLEWTLLALGVALGVACATDRAGPSATPTPDPQLARAEATVAALRATRAAENARATATAAATATVATVGRITADERLQAAMAARDGGDYTRALAEAREALALEPSAEAA
jgi:hypothetical protein